MSFPSYGDSPRNVTAYLGQNYRYAPVYYRGRNPASTDIRPKENQGYYPIGSIWITKLSTPEIWILAEITSVNAAPSANWVLIANSLITGPLLSLSDNSGTVVPPSLDTANPPGNIQLKAGAGITVVANASANTITITNTGSASTETLTGNDGVAVAASGGTIRTLGATVSNNTFGQALYTNNPSSNIEQFNVQLSTAIASTDATLAKVGVAVFNSGQFSVDGNGFVSLSGGGSAQTLTTQDATVVTPSAGNINLSGSGSTTTVGSGSTATVELTGLTNHNVLVGAGTTTITKVAPSATSGVPLISQGSSSDPTFGTAVVAGGGTGATTLTGILTGNGTSPITANAVTQFQVLVAGASNAVSNVTGTGTLGQVLTSNGAGANPTWQTVSTSGVSAITVDSGGAGANPVVPTGGGGMTFTGGTSFTTGTQANPIRIQTPSANTINWEIQYAGGNAGASTPNNYGVSQYNSNHFSVSSGFVDSFPITINTGAGLSGGGTINLGGSLTLTASAASFSWSDQSSSFGAAANNGYFCTATLTATLPASPSQSNEIQFVVVSGTTTITANTGQKIRLGNSITASAGTAANIAVGASISLVFRASDSVWYAFGSTGNWTLT